MFAVRAFDLLSKFANSGDLFLDSGKMADAMVVKFALVADSFNRIQRRSTEGW